MLDAAEFEQISVIWGTKWADVLITDRRWPTCDQPAAIIAVGLVVDRAIAGIVAILDGGADFKPHTRMMAGTIHAAFWNSMPDTPRGISAGTKRERKPVPQSNAKFRRF
jgi:hypothetical protein